MDAAIEENGGSVDTTCSDLNSSAVKINGEVNGSYTEPMEVDEEEEVIPVKKIASDINCVGDVDKKEVKEVNEEAIETDKVGAVPICEVPISDVDENVSSNGFGEDCSEGNKGHISTDDSQDEANFEEIEKMDDDDSCQITSCDPLANNESSLDCNDSNLESNFDNSQSESAVAIDTTDTSDCITVEPSDPLAVNSELEESEYKVENEVSDDINEDNSLKDFKSETEDISVVEEDKNVNDVQCASEKAEDLTGEKSRSEDDPLDCSSDKGKKTKKVQQPINVTPRRSSRNLNKQKSYIEKEDELKDLEIIKSNKRPNDDPDIEEITPVDPLAADPVPEYFRDKEINKLRMSKKTTIVVSDTKRLVEIASSGKQSKMNKKEPTLVIIDTNSILSGRGPIPISSSSSIPGTSRNQGYSVLPVALPAQGMYPQMRAHSQVKTMTVTSSQPSSLQIQSQAKPPIILPSLTDDMYVVEAPSFIVPYVYEKPPIKPLKDYVSQIEQAIKEIKEQLEKEKLEQEKLEQEKLDKEKLDQEKKDAETKTDELKQDEESVEEAKIKEGGEEAVEKENKEKVQDDSKMEVEEENKDDKNKIDDVKSEELNDNEMKMEVDKEKDHDDKNESSNDKHKDDVDKPDEPKESTEKPNEEIEAVKVLESKACDNITKPSSEEKVKEENENIKSTEEKSDLEKSKKTSHSYFDNPLGKFFIQIGVNLVQEHVQTDLLRSQKRKKDRDGSKCAPEVQMAITSLIRTLEFSKENNEPFRLEQKKCEFCSFKTESMLVMAHHLETPHMRNYVYRCNFCPLEVRSPHDILFHMEAEHNVRGRLERAPAFHQCPSCPFEDNQKGKLTRHLLSCAKKYRPERNQEPPLDFEPPAKIPRISRNRPSMSPGNAVYQAAMSGLKQGVGSHPLLPKLVPTAAPSVGQTLLNRGRGRPQMINRYIGDMRPSSPLAAQQKAMAAAAQMRPGMLYRPSGSNSQPQVLLPTSYQLTGNQIYQNSGSSQKSSSSTSSGGAGAAAKLLQQPSISITPLPRQQSTPAPTPTPTHGKPGRPLGSGKATFVICEICDGYIKDLEQLRNHMQWIHKVKIHPKMIYNRPPLNCQKCQFRFFTDQGLERHLLGSHGLVTSSMQEAANRGKDGGRCPVCGRVYQWKLLNHVARDHNMSLKPAHLSYKCTVCTATFGMYKQFENHVYSAHSVVAKRVMDKKPATSPSQPSTSSSSHQGDSLLKPLKINDEITIIPQPVRSAKPVSKPGPSSRTAPQSSKGKV